jgi:hypothetical protein
MGAGVAKKKSRHFFVVLSNPAMLCGGPEKSEIKKNKFTFFKKKRAIKSKNVPLRF